MNLIKLAKKTELSSLFFGIIDNKPYINKKEPNHDFYNIKHNRIFSNIFYYININIIVSYCF